MSGKEAEDSPTWLPSWMSEKYIFVFTSVCFGLMCLMSLLIFAPLAATVDNFEGNCYLFSSEEGFGAASLCSYCIAVAVILFIFCGLRLALLIAKITRFRETIPENVFNWFSVGNLHYVIYILDVMLAVLLLVTASILSAGLSNACYDLFGGRSECTAESTVIFGKGKVSPPFYKALALAEGCAWFTFCFWALIVFLETVMLWENGTFAKML